MRIGHLQAISKYDYRVIISFKQLPLEWSPFLHIVPFYLFRTLGLSEYFSTRACIMGSTKTVISMFVPPQN